MTAPVSVGDVLAGKYLVERVLGVGGMGVVVAAKHLQLDERVAIKFLLPESLEKPGLVARFLREGRLAAKIRSDHVARVRDVGTLESGSPYLVLEYLDGIDLNDLIAKRGPLPVETGVDYILQICEALAEAHSLGIVHRDLKPANLFLTTRPDGSSCVKLIDFGISKLAGGSEGELNLTKTAEVRGSPFFMSPEQLMASPAIDARSDIWALGVTLQNLLTKAQPFPAESMPELCAKILNADPAPLRAVRPDAPEGLEAVLRQCLQKRAADRYSSVAELATALAPFAPPQARISVDRISRILNVPVPPAGPVVVAPLPLVTPSERGPKLHYAATVEARPGATPQAQTPIESPEALLTAGPATWSRTGSAVPPGRRPLLAFAFALVALLIVGGGAAALLWSRAPVTPSQASDSASSAPSIDLGGSAEARAPAPIIAPAVPSVSPSGPAPAALTSAAPVGASAPSVAMPATSSPSSARGLPSVKPATGAPTAAPTTTAAAAATPAPAATVKPKTGSGLFDTSL